MRRFDCLIVSDFRFVTAVTAENMFFSDLTRISSVTGPREVKNGSGALQGGRKRDFDAVEGRR